MSRIRRWSLRALSGLALVLAAGCQTPGTGPGGFTSGGSSNEEDIWSIRCITLDGPQRFEQAEAYAKALKNVKRLKPDLVQVMTDEDGAHVFYGRYRRQYGGNQDVPQFRPDPRPDLDVVRALMLQANGQNTWPFILATLDVLPTYRSVHPEWNLENADGYWALHVAVFYNTEQMRTRRTAAEEYCKVLREQGEPAYFHHAAANSSVYVGTYPRGAVTNVREENPLSGTVTTKLRIVDPQMLAAQQRFPHSTQNGYEFYEIIRDPATGEVRDRIPTPSFPVITPKAQRLLDERER